MVSSPKAPTTHAIALNVPPRQAPRAPVHGFRALLCGPKPRLHAAAAAAAPKPPTSPQGTSASAPAAPPPVHDARPEAKAGAREANVGSGDDPLDAGTRRAAQLAPPTFTPPAPAPAAAAPAPTAEPARIAMSMEQLLPALVRRVSWAGDARRGTVRLELGAGGYEGATLLVHAEEGRVRVSVDGRTSGDLDVLRERIEARLRRKGIVLDGVE